MRIRKSALIALSFCLFSQSAHSSSCDSYFSSKRESRNWWSSLVSATVVLVCGSHGCSPLRRDYFDTEFVAQNREQLKPEQVGTFQFKRRMFYRIKIAEIEERLKELENTTVTEADLKSIAYKIDEALDLYDSQRYLKNDGSDSLLNTRGELVKVWPWLRNAYADEHRRSVQIRLYFACNFIGIPFVASEALASFVHDIFSGYEYVGPWNADTHREIQPVIRRTLEMVERYQMDTGDELVAVGGLEIPAPIEAELQARTAVDDAGPKIRRYTGEIRGDFLEQAFHFNDDVSAPHFVTAFAFDGSPSYQIGYFLVNQPDMSMSVFEFLTDQALIAEKENPSPAYFAEDAAQRALGEVRRIKNPSAAEIFRRLRFFATPEGSAIYEALGDSLFESGKLMEAGFSYQLAVRALELSRRQEEKQRDYRRLESKLKRNGEHLVAEGAVGSWDGDYVEGLGRQLIEAKRREVIHEAMNDWMNSSKKDGARLHLLLTDNWGLDVEEELRKALKGQDRRSQLSFLKFWGTDLESLRIRLQIIEKYGPY